MSQESSPHAPSAVKVDSMKSMLRAIKNGAKCAVYESMEYQFDNSTADYENPFLIPAAPATAIAEILRELEKSGLAAAERMYARKKTILKTLLRKEVSDARLRKFFERFFDARTHEIFNAWRAFGKSYSFDFRHINIGNIVTPSQRLLTEPWHRDDEGGYAPKGTLVYLKIIKGPSTETADDMGGSNPRTYSNGASLLLTTGASGAVHRAPKWTDGRLALKIWLVPRNTQR